MLSLLSATLLMSCTKQGAPSHSGEDGAEPKFTSLSSSADTTCVRDIDGMVSCWGFRGSPLTGSGEIPEDEEGAPWGYLRIGPGIPEHIATTLHTLCWVDDEGDVGCLGGSFWGLDIPTVKDFVPMTAGYLAVLPDGTIDAQVPWKIDIPEQAVDVVGADLYWCFGLADGTWDCGHKSPTGPQGSIDILVNSWCALSSAGEVQCWDTANGGSELHIVDGPVDWTEIRLSGGFACGLRPDRSAECQRDAEMSEDQTWHGPDLASQEPVKMMDCTMYSCCAVLESGALDCWGSGVYGEIPDFVLK